MSKYTKISMAALFLAVTPFSALLQAETLEDIYRQALTNDHQFRAAQAAFEAVQEDKAIGRAGLLPQLGAEGSWNKSEVTREGEIVEFDPDAGPFIAPAFAEGNTTRSGYSISLSQPLFDLGAWYGYKQGKVSSQIAAAELNSAEQNLIIRTAQAYFDALEAVDALETARAEEEALSHQLEQTKQRFEVGLTAITEVHEAQAAFDSATANRLLAEGQLGISFEALEVITGRPYNNISPLQREFPVTPPTPLEREEWVEFALENNFELRAAKLSAEFAKQTAKIRKAAHFPTLSAGANVSDFDTESDNGDLSLNDTTLNEQVESVGVTLTVPLFSGGAISAQRRQAAARYIEARELYLLTQRDLVQVTRSAYLSVVTSVATVKARQQAIRSSQSALEATQAGYEVGTRDLVDVLNAQRNLFRAQRDYYDALYTYVLGTLRLKEAAGMLSVDDVLALSNWLDPEKSVSPM